MTTTDQGFAVVPVVDVHAGDEVDVLGVPHRVTVVTEGAHDVRLSFLDHPTWYYARTARVGCRRAT